MGAIWLLVSNMPTDDDLKHATSKHAMAASMLRGGRNTNWMKVR